MRAALVHYWLLNQRGGEAVLEALCELLPEADIFTLFYDPARVSPKIRRHTIRASFLNPFRRYYRSLLPLMPIALEQFDLRGYDLVVSSESGPAKGVLPAATARHVCYCHTPMRYLWDLYPDYLREWTPAWKRPFLTPVSSYLRLWDFATAARVDDFIANSENVKRRIRRCYRRDAQVIYPPVAVERFYWNAPEDYFLIVGELVPYKRFDIAVRVLRLRKARLRIVGDGPEYRNLKSLAAGSAEFCGRVSDAELRELYARCRALILPGEEDFGITAVEALASGKPVIALGRGGAVEIVPAAEPLGGVFFSTPDDQALARALDQFTVCEPTIQSSALQAWAARFSRAEFLRKMRGVLLRHDGAAPEESGSYQR